MTGNFFGKMVLKNADSKLIGPVLQLTLNIEGKLLAALFYL
jgi:sporulation protein YlmC with PRC-barrel domain